MAASLLQVPVKHLQHFVALASWPQTQPKELLYLRSRGWYHGTHRVREAPTGWGHRRARAGVGWGESSRTSLQGP